MTSNQVIAYSEIIAFFLVTIDLYGKERLIKLQQQLIHIFSPDNKGRHPLASILALLFTFAFTLWSVIPILLIIAFDYYVYSNFNLIIITITFLLSSIIILLLIVLTPVVHFWGAVFADQILNIIITFIFSSIIKVMTLLKLEGMLLYIGAVIYVCAKIYQSNLP